MSDLFENKRGLITGVFNNKSLAWSIAEQVMAGGGICGFTHMPDKPDDERKKNQNRLVKLTKDCENAKFIMPMDATVDDHIESVMQRCGQEFGKMDFLLHSIAFAPPEDLKGDTIDTSRDGFKLAMEISAYSLIALSRAARPFLNPGASILTLTYLGGEQAVPGYNVMGVCKAALDSIVKYLAFDLGKDDVRVNALSPGPMKTVSGVGAGVEAMIKLYESMAPMGRVVTHEEVGKSGAYLLSDMSSGVSGDIVHLDGGYHMMGSPGRLLEQL